MQDKLAEKIKSVSQKNQFEVVDELLPVLSGRTDVSIAGFPIINQQSFEYFLAQVPHLFSDGLKIIHFLENLDKALTTTDEFAAHECLSVQRAIKTIQTMVYTAAITSPPDLWVLRQVLSTYSELGITSHFLNSDWLEVDQIQKEFGLQQRQLHIDLSLLFRRGYIERRDHLVRLRDTETAKEVFSQITVLPETHRGDWVGTIVAKLQEKDLALRQKGLLKGFLSMRTAPLPKKTWVANHFEIQLGFRIVPMVLALRSLDLSKKLKCGANFSEMVSQAMPEVLRLFQLAGYIDQQNRVTLLGERVFQRGPGPFGIVHAYHPYTKIHHDLLTGSAGQPWVVRGENVAASQDANAKTFEMINQSLDQFCAKYGFFYNVYVEHAVGQGEATRQRFQQNGEDDIQYFGADLEDGAIDKALEAQKLGLLPENMMFVRNADIGSPETLINSILSAGFKTENAVMVVGNGFHEVRNQTDEKMISVFEKYQEAGLLIIFAEETSLSEVDNLKTGWNTYHAGFSYCHNISGQGLRTSHCVDEDEKGTDSENQLGWFDCAQKGGYKICREFTTRTRPIYPYQGGDHINPSVSVNYFCVPKKLAQKLKISS